MKGIRIQNDAQGSRAVWDTVPDPAVGPDEVLISVAYAGVNRADLLQREGKYPPPPGVSDILGLEVSGRIAAVGARVSAWNIGDAVCALLAGGGYAERVSVHGGSVIKLPAKASLIEGAAIPEAFITAYTNLFFEGELRTGESVLIHGGSSGVGTAAIQLAKAVGARVAVTVGSDEKGKRCEELGADLAVNYKHSDFEQAVRDWGGEFGVDLILDCVGGPYLSKNLSVLGTGGRLVLIATMEGATGELHIPTLMRKRATVIGSVLRTRTLLEKSELIREFNERFGSYLEFGKIKPVIDEVFSFQNVDQAHAKMKASVHVGKIVLRIGGEE
jgi:NADPH2:quinone reductase